MAEDKSNFEEAGKEPHPNQTIFSKIPQKIQKTPQWTRVFTEAHYESDTPIGEKYDTKKVDQAALSKYYEKEASPVLDSGIPEEVLKDPIFAYEEKHFGKKEALKAYLYRKDLREEELEEAMKSPRKN